MIAIHQETHGQGRTLVLVHGWAMHSGIWREFAKQLATRYRVVCLDLPGHGRSGSIASFTLPLISKALLEAIPAEKFTLLGWSLGATVAIDMAMRAPERVESLILLAGNPKFVEGEDWSGVKPWVLDGFAEQLHGDLSKTLMRFLALQVNGLADGKRLLQMLKEAMQECEPPSIDVLEQGLDILRHADLRTELKALACPVSLIMGDRDGLVPVACGNAVRSLHPNLTVKILEKAGHVPFLSHSQPLMQILDGILSDGQRLDKPEIKRSFGAAAHNYDELATLQRQVGDDLLDKYPPALELGVTVDLGCGTGFLSRRLARDFSRQRLVALDIALPMLQFSKQRNVGMRIDYLCADAEKMPFAGQSIRQVYSNLALQWCQDLPAFFFDCKRVLELGGRLVFSTFGPETLKELKAAWASVDDYPHVNDFYSAEQIQGFLQQAGFEAIETESKLYRTLYPSVMALMRELKGIGAHNANLARNRRPTTRQQLQSMISAYETSMGEGGIMASYEIIFVRASV